MLLLASLHRGLVINGFDLFPSGICIAFCLKVLKLFYPIVIILEENWGLGKFLVSMDQISGVFCWWDYLDLGNFETLWLCILLGLFFFSYLRFLILGSHLKNGPSKFVFFIAFFFGETFSDNQTMCMCFPSIWECWGLVIYFFAYLNTYTGFFIWVSLDLQILKLSILLFWYLKLCGETSRGSMSVLQF